MVMELQLSLLSVLNTYLIGKEAKTWNTTCNLRTCIFYSIGLSLILWIDYVIDLKVSTESSTLEGKTMLSETSQIYILRCCQLSQKCLSEPERACAKRLSQKCRFRTRRLGSAGESAGRPPHSPWSVLLPHPRRRR